MNQSEESSGGDGGPCDEPLLELHGRKVQSLQSALNSQLP